MMVGLKALLISAALVCSGGLAHADSAGKAPRPDLVQLTDAQMDAAVAGHLHGPAPVDADGNYIEHNGPHWKEKFVKMFVLKDGKRLIYYKKVFYAATGLHTGCGIKACSPNPAPTSPATN
jgi:hypothetical protein